MQYAFNIIGTGAEVTQGRVTKEFIDEIYNNFTEGDTLEDYFLYLDDDSEICWYDIDDNFHSTGAYIDKCTVSVYTLGTANQPGTKVYEAPGTQLQIITNYVTEEVYPLENSIHGSISILTCQDICEGFIFTGILEIDEFDPNLLFCDIDTLGDIILIKAVYYDGNPIEVDTMIGAHHKKFIVDLAE